MFFLIVFRNEGLLHSQLHHPAILKLFTFFEDADADYFIMELCENGDLRKYMKQYPFDENQVILTLCFSNFIVFNR